MVIMMTLFVIANYHTAHVLIDLFHTLCLLHNPVHKFVNKIVVNKNTLCEAVISILALQTGNHVYLISSKGAWRL
jgi:hypothetical protein